MDKELPWLADNAQLELKYKKGKTPLSHRNWPGEPVPVITESIIQTLSDELLLDWPPESPDNQYHLNK